MFAAGNMNAVLCICIIILIIRKISTYEKSLKENLFILHKVGNVLLILTIT